MQMETTLPASPASVVKTLVFSRVGRKHLLLGGLALALISGGLIWQWSWLVAVGVAPLLVSAVPCVAMCALGLCMHRMSSHSGGAVQNGTPEIPSSQQES
jgi:hypothetical protein